MEGKFFKDPTATDRETSNIAREREDLMREKKERLEGFTSLLESYFGEKKLPEELQENLVAIRRKIRSKIEEHEYVDDFSFIENEVARIAVRIDKWNEIKAGTFDFEGVQEIKIQDVEEEGTPRKLHLISEGNKVETMSGISSELFESLDDYFKSYAEVRNVFNFRSNVSQIREEMVLENKIRKLNFYKEDEKKDVFQERLMKKYEAIGFSKEEFDDLIEFCDLADLDKIQVYELKSWRKAYQVVREYTQGERKKYLFWSMALILPAIAKNYAPTYFADAFDPKNSAEIAMLLGKFGILSALGSAGEIFINHSFNKMSQDNLGKEGGMAEATSKNIVEFPGNELKNFGLKDMKVKTNNALSEYNYLYKSLGFDVLPAITSFIVSAYILYQRNPALVPVAGGIAGGSIWVTQFLEKKMDFFGKMRKTKEKQVATEKKIEELINAHMEIIISGEKDNFSHNLEKLLGSEYAEQIAMQEIKMYRNAVQEVIGNVALYIMGIGSQLLGGFRADNVVAMLMQTRSIQNSLNQFSNIRSRIIESVRDIKEAELMFNGYASEEIESEKNRISASEVMGNDLTFSNVTLKNEQKNFFREADFSIPAGSLAYLEGESGAGKSILVKLMCGYYPPTTGEVSIGDTSVEKIKRSGPDSVYKKFAYLPQFPTIFERSVKENLLFGIDSEIAKEISNEEIKGALREVKLSTRFTSIHEKMAFGRGDDSAVSGGENSRLGLARILMQIRHNKSRIVLLDEPTASVDPKTKKLIAETLKREKEKNPEMTIIVISHDTEFVSMLKFNKTIVISDGKAIEKEEQ